MKPKEVLAFAKANKVEIVDLKFVDLPGLWQHFSISTSELNEDLFAHGIGFDGSSIRGFQAINESDMLLMPDPNTAMMDPFTELPTLSLICNIKDPITGQSYTRDPRYVAQKAEKYLLSTGIADTSYWGPEIDMRYTTLARMADQVLLYKYVIKNVGRRRGKTVTMMPKPLFQDNGSGMHTHQSLWKKGKNIFYDKKGYALLSDTARHYIGGLLKHADALCGLIAPTTNSYRRLVPGYEAPINLAYSQRNRSACIRIPTYSTSEKARRLEFRTPDPSCNPYLAFPAMLMAGLDGVKNKIEPPAPVEKDLYELPPEQAKKIKSMPGSLEQALDALEKDHDFLLQGGVFTPDVIETWLDYKRKREVDPVRLRPHPHEFALYYDI